ncbi:MAG: OmpH family outer membrane protein [Planctomycetaceae bacterium]
MKKLILSLLAITLLASTSDVFAQDAGRSSIGLIDMAHVFQNYKKFEDLRAGLQAEIEKADAELQQKAEVMKQMQEELKRFEQGSAEYERGEKALLEAKGDIQAFQAATQRKLARRESEMFKVIYSDVTQAVTLGAQHMKFTVVMRFNRKEIDDSTSPAEAVQTMNKTILYFQPENDMTDSVLKYLNNRYEASSDASRPPVQPASAQSPAPNRNRR